MKVILYTCNFRNYDTFKNTPKIHGVDCVYFTDNKNLHSDTWNIKILECNFIDKDPQRASRWVKTHPIALLPEHDISIWLDSSFVPKMDSLSHLINISKKHDISMYPHPVRDCLYDEGRVCSEFGLDDSDLIAKQLFKYEKEYFPRNYGLYSTGLIIRNNNDKVKKYNELWWEQIKNGSKRDQLSQSYVSWKLGMPINKLTLGTIYENPWFQRTKHIHKMKKKWKIS